MANRQLYCKYCGTEIKTGNFCPNCGAAIDGVVEPITNSSPKYEDQPQYTQYRADDRNDHDGLRIGLSILLLLTGLIFLASAFIIITGVNTIMDSPDFAEMLRQLKELGYNDEQIRGLISLCGYLSAVPGILAILAAICGFLRVGYVFGLIVCIVLTVFSIPTILGLIIGIIVTYLWTKTSGSYEKS